MPMGTELRDAEAIEVTQGKALVDACKVRPCSSPRVPRPCAAEHTLMPSPAGGRRRAPRLLEPAERRQDQRRQVQARHARRVQGHRVRVRSEPAAQRHAPPPRCALTAARLAPPLSVLSLTCSLLSPTLQACSTPTSTGRRSRSVSVRLRLALDLVLGFGAKLTSSLLATENNSVRFCLPLKPDTPIQCVDDRYDVGNFAAGASRPPPPLVLGPLLTFFLRARSRLFRRSDRHAQQDVRSPSSCHDAAEARPRLPHGDGRADPVSPSPARRGRRDDGSRSGGRRGSRGIHADVPVRRSRSIPSPLEALELTAARRAGSSPTASMARRASPPRSSMMRASRTLACVRRTSSRSSSARASASGSRRAEEGGAQLRAGGGRRTRFSLLACCNRSVLRVARLGDAGEKRERKSGTLEPLEEKTTSASSRTPSAGSRRHALAGTDRRGSKICCRGRYEREREDAAGSGIGASRQTGSLQSPRPRSPSAVAARPSREERARRTDRRNEGHRHSQGVPREGKSPAPRVVRIELRDLESRTANCTQAGPPRSPTRLVPLRAHECAQARGERAERRREGEHRTLLAHIPT